MRRLTYSRKTSIVLHVEDYSNAGLTQDKMMKSIEKLDGVWMVKPYPINSNIEVCINGNSRALVDEIAFEIKNLLENLLFKLK